METFVRCACGVCRLLVVVVRFFWCLISLVVCVLLLVWCLCGVCVLFVWCLCGVCVLFVWCFWGCCDFWWLLCVFDSCELVVMRTFLRYFW